MNRLAWFKWQKRRCDVHNSYASRQKHCTRLHSNKKPTLLCKTEPFDLVLIYLPLLPSEHLILNARLVSNLQDLKCASHFLLALYVLVLSLFLGYSVCQNIVLSLNIKWFLLNSFAPSNRSDLCFSPVWFDRSYTCEKYLKNIVFEHTQFYSEINPDWCAFLSPWQHL